MTYPTTLDTLTNPTSASFLDTSGLELDVLISRLQDIAEALEAKVGYGGSAQSPVANTVLAGGGAGITTWRAIATTDLEANAISQRWYSAPSSTTTTAPASYATMHTNTQTFGGGNVRMDAHLNLSNGTACVVQIGAQVDSGGTTLICTLAVPANTNVPVSVGFNFSTLSGSHAVKLMWNTTAGTIQTGSGCIMILEELKA